MHEHLEAQAGAKLLQDELWLKLATDLQLVPAQKRKALSLVAQSVVHINEHVARHKVSGRKKSYMNIAFKQGKGLYIISTILKSSIPVFVLM